MPLRDDLQNMADQAAQAHGLDPGLFRAVIQTESGWNPKAVSKSGALGLGQLMPGTAQALGVTNPYDPQQNLNASARYLSSLHQQFGDENLALAAYNAGPGAVQKYGGVPPFKETQNYIQRIQSLRGAGPATSDGGGRLKWLSAPSAGTPPAMSESAGRLKWLGEAPEATGPKDINALQNRTAANLFGLSPGIQSALTSAAKDLQGQGVDLGSLITSGFRSRADQERLYQEKLAGGNPNPVAAPGMSLHESGNAVDISMKRIPSGMQGTVLATLAKYGLARPNAKDPVHFELATNTKPAPAAADTGPGRLVWLSSKGV